MSKLPIEHPTKSQKNNKNDLKQTAAPRVQNSYYIKEIDAYGNQLHKAVYTLNYKLAADLLKSGFDVNSRTAEKESASQWLKKVLTLSIFSRNGGFTPLHIAELKSSNKMTALLLSYDADIKIADKHNNLPLSLTRYCEVLAVSKNPIVADLSPLTSALKPNEVITGVQSLASSNKLVSLKLGRISSVSLSGGSQLSECQLFKLLKVLTSCKSLRTLHMSLPISIYSSTQNGIGETSYKQREEYKKSLNFLLKRIKEFLSAGNITSIKMGKIEHEHVDYSSSISSRMNSNGVWETTRESDEKSTTRTILKIDNSSIFSVANDEKAARQKLDEVARDGAFYSAMFTSIFRKKSRKISLQFFEPSSIISFCKDVASILISNKKKKGLELEEKSDYVPSSSSSPSI